MQLRSQPPRDPVLIASLLCLWEASVRATHHFLTETDIQMLIPLVREGLAHIPVLVLAVHSEKPERGEAIRAFMGLDGSRLEMLFVDPEARGQGIGKALVHHAIGLGVREVCVNEQNPAARGFYAHLGFVVVKRTPLDEQGNPFPLLYMERSSQDT